MRGQCPHGKGPRSLTLEVQEVHEVLVQRQAEQCTQAFLSRYHRRAGVEGTISQAVRTTDLRRSPYVGLRKTQMMNL